jgi:hypothetical protein
VNVSTDDQRNAIRQWLEWGAEWQRYYGAEPMEVDWYHLDAIGEPLGLTYVAASGYLLGIPFGVAS